MIEAIVNAVVRAHRPVLLLSLALGIASAGLLVKPGLREDYTIASLIAADDAAYHQYLRFSNEFVSGELAMFAIDAGDPLEPRNLGLLHSICRQALAIEGVESSLAISELPELGLEALFTSGKDLQTIHDRLTEDPGARDKIARDLRDNPLVVGSLVGQDPNTGDLNTTAGVVIQVAGEDYGKRRKLVADQLRAISQAARKHRPDATILLGGPIIGLIEIFEAIRRDMAVFSVVVFVLICTALWLIFRRTAPVLVALTATGLSTLCVLGLSVLSNLPMSLVSQVVVILVTILGTSMCVHLLVAHNETRAGRADHARGPMHDARETVRRMLLPCSLVTITTTLGVAALFISSLKPAKHMASLVIAGVVMALLLGLTAIPGLARLAARTPPVNHEAGLLSRALTGVGSFTSSGKKRTIYGVILFGLFAAVCLVKVPAALRSFEADFVKNFREDSNVRRVYRFVSENLGPVGSIEVIVRRNDDEPILGESTTLALKTSRLGHRSRTMSDDERAERDRDTRNRIARQLRLRSGEERAGIALMQTVDEFQARVEDELDPPVRKTISLVDLVKYASVGRLLRLPVLELPTFEWQFALTMVLIDQKLSRGMMRHFLSDDGRALRINLRATESDDVYNKLAVIESVETIARKLFGPDFKIEVTGLYPLYAKIAADLLRDQLRTFALALVLIAVCMCVGLQSVRLGLLSMIPNLVPMIFCMGVMGWAAIPINMATAMMLSIALGIAVDNTIHYLWRFRRELDVDQDYRAAIMRTHRTVGRACVYNSVVLVSGFWILCLSEFVPTIYFGMLIGLTMIGALIGDMILLPMLLTLLRPIRAKRFEV